MDYMTSILGGLVIALVSGSVGKMLGANGTIKKSECGERQHACQALVIEKINNLSAKVDGLTKAVNDKIFGL